MQNRELQRRGILVHAASEARKMDRVALVTEVDMECIVLEIEAVLCIESK
jgi:hypothetical protein